MLFHIFPAVDRAAIGFIEDNQEFAPQWWQLRDGDPASVIRISQTIVRHVAETSEAVLTNDALEDFGNAHSVRELPMRSVMCAPLINADEQVFGLIHVDAGRADMFNALDLEVLASVAMQLSLAINFSRLHAIGVEAAILRRDVEQARAVQ
jgi:GAF domain-containing protein